MQQLSARLAATIVTTLHVFDARLKEDKGQASAEYIGILAFVALLIVALTALAAGFGTSIGGVVTKAITKISNTLGA